MSYLDGEIKVGDRLIWEPRDSRAYERVVVTEIREFDRELRIETEGRNGRRYWNSESRVREACIRDETPLQEAHTP